MSTLTELPYGVRFFDETPGSVDILFAHGEAGETDRLNEAGVPSLCLATSDAIWGVAGLFEKFQSTNDPLSDWRRIIWDVNDGTGTDYCYQRWAGASNVTNWETIDAGVRTSLVAACEWGVTALNAAGAVEHYRITGLHNGTSAAAATAASLSGMTSVHRIGNAAIPGLQFSVALSGSPQKISLRARADTACDFTVTMLGWTQHDYAARYTKSQLE